MIFVCSGHYGVEPYLEVKTVSCTVLSCIWCYVWI